MEYIASPEKEPVPLHKNSTASGSYRGYPAIPSGKSEFAGESEPGLIEYWRMLRRHRGSILLLTLAGAISAVLITFSLRPVYSARTSVEIQGVNNDFMNTRQISPVEEGAANQNVLTDVLTQMKIIQSEALVDRVLDKLKSEGKLGPLQRETGHLSAILQALHISRSQPGNNDYKVRQTAIKNLTVHQLGETRVVEIFYSSNDPVFAAEFLNQLGSEYIESNMEARWKMSQHMEEWLSRHLGEMRANLERSESALQQYANRSGLLFTAPLSDNAEQTNVSEDKLRQLQEELSRAEGARADAESHYETAKSASPETLSEMLSDDSLKDLQTKLTDLRRQEADLASIYTPKNEKFKRIEAQIVPIEEAFNTQRNDILTRIRNDYSTAVRREKILKDDYSAQASVVTDQADKAIHYNILKREVDSNRQLYQSMLGEVKEASIASAIRATNVRILDRAKVPHDPSSPDFPLNVALGLIVGLMAGVGSVIVRERANRTLQEPGEAEFWLNLPELGIIPSRSLDSKLPFGRKAVLQGKEGGLPGHAKRGLGSPTRGPGHIAEGFRTVLASVMFAGENGSRPRVLVLTSASQMEGKTTVVSNLGIAMAEIGQRVLIIDADLRQPCIHRIFDLTNERGLTTFLQEPASASSNGDELIQATFVSGLHVLPSGPPAEQAANLLYSPKLRDLLAHVRSKFDMVLIDTPPSLQMSDARVLGRLADGVVIVNRSGKTTREAAIAVNQKLIEDRTRVLGTILNDWDPKKSPNGYYGYRSDSVYGGNRYSGERETPATQIS